MLTDPVESVESSREKSRQKPFDLGGRVQELRRARGMSQRELARRAGVTNGAISMIEQNRVSPSVASLKKILAVFDFSMSSFFSEDFAPDAKVFYRADELVSISDGAVRLRQVGAVSPERKLQVLHELYAPGGDTGPSMLVHEGEESGVVVRGKIEITVGDQHAVLGPGDGYYFPSRLPHRFRNPGPDECEIVSSCTPPSF